MIATINSNSKKVVSYFNGAPALLLEVHMRRGKPNSTNWHSLPMCA